MNIIFWRELKSNIRPTLIWSAAMLALAVIGYGEYSIVVGGGSGIDMDIIVNMMPRILRVMFGMGAIPLGTPEGWYVCMYLWCAIISYVHAALIGANIISKEESDRTAEFLYTKPISRSAVVAGKTLAAVICTSIVVLAGWAGAVSVFGLYIGETGLLYGINITSLGMLVTSFVFLFIGLWLSTALTGRGRAVQASAGLVIVCYFISVFVELFGNIDFMGVLTPFRYFVAADLLNGNISGLYVGLAVAIIAISGILTHVQYKRRNLHC